MKKTQKPLVKLSNHDKSKLDEQAKMEHIKKMPNKAQHVTPLDVAKLLGVEEEYKELLLKQATKSSKTK